MRMTRRAAVLGLDSQDDRRNPLWGEERIANELFVKLGIRVSPRTVGKSMPQRRRRQRRGGQRWSTFVKNHANGIVACDFFVAVTATFRMLYVFVVIEYGTRLFAEHRIYLQPKSARQSQTQRAIRRATLLAVSLSAGPGTLLPPSTCRLAENAGAKKARPQLRPPRSRGQRRSKPSRWRRGCLSA